MKLIMNKLHPAWLFSVCCILLLSTACRTASVTAGYPTSDADGWRMIDTVLERIQPPTFPDRDFVITDYGAKQDNDATQAIRTAIDACHAAGGGRVVIPAGKWLTGALFLRSNVNLHLEEGARLEWSFNLDDYPLVFTRWEGVECMNFSPLIYAYEQENIAITGKGTLDGGGSNETWWLWNPKDKSLITEKHSMQHEDRLALIEMGNQGVPVEERVFGKGHYLRPNFIQPYKCRNILIEGITILRSPMWEIHPVLSTNITVRGVTITTHGPNNDGCDPESSRDVLIEDCLFDTGDDCIAIKSGRNNDGRRVNVPSENIIVRNCVMKDGHGGVVLGSECSGHIRNVWVENCRMDSPNLDRALRFKDNAVRGGILENVFMRDIEVGQVAEAVLTIDLLYEEGSKGDHQPIVRNVQMERITSSASPRVMFIRGFEGAVIDDIRISDSTFKGVTHTEVVEHAGSIRLENVNIIPTAKEKARNTIPDRTVTASPLFPAGILKQIQPPTFADRDFPVTDIGANDEGKTDCTKAFAKAIAACSEAGGDWAGQMAHTVMERNADLMSMDFASRLKWSYTYGLMLKAMWAVWEKTEDPDILAYIESYYDTLIEKDGTIQTYDISKYNIDMINPGKALINLYDQTGKEKYKKAIMTLRAQMKDHPRTKEGGFWHKQRYTHQMWLDGLYMGSPFLAQYAQRFDEPALLDDAANQIILMEKHARDPETGLLYHGWDESREQKWADPETGCSPNFWGRAMGWYAMAVVDVLDYLPADHPARTKIIAILDRMFTALAKVQDPDTGLWYQVLDQGHRKDNYLEASASTMFAYSMAKAVRKGYVDDKYLAVARKGYKGLLSKLVTVDEKGWVDIHQCCAVAGLGGNPYRDGSYEYYVGEEIRDNDPKAVGPFILAALEMERAAK